MNIVIRLLIISILFIPSVLATRQIFTTNMGAFDVYNDDWAILNGGFHGEAYNSSNAPIAADGTIHNLTVVIADAPGSTWIRTFSLYKNGVFSGITCYIRASATSCSDTSHSVSVNAGDNLSMLQSPAGAPAVTTGRFSLVFDTDEANTSVLFGRTYISSATNTSYMAAHGYGGGSNPDYAITLVPGDFNITEWYLTRYEDPSSGYINFTLLMNETIPIAKCVMETGSQNCQNTSLNIPIHKWDTLIINVSKNYSVTGYTASGIKLKSWEDSQYIMATSSNGVLPNYFTPTKYAKVVAGVSGLGTSTTSVATHASANYTVVRALVKQVQNPAPSVYNHSFITADGQTPISCIIQSSGSNNCEITNQYNGTKGYMYWKIVETAVYIGSPVGCAHSLLVTSGAAAAPPPPPYNPCNLDCAVNTTISTNLDCLGNELVFRGSLVTDRIEINANISNFTIWSITTCIVGNLQNILY